MTKPPAAFACRVCLCTAEMACEGVDDGAPCWWVANDLCSECVAAAAHDAPEPRNGRGRSPDGVDLFATCSCGWRVAIRHGEEDEPIAARRRHWQRVVAAVTHREFANG